MQDTSQSDKKASDTTVDAQRINHIAGLIHEMRSTGCQVIDVVGQAQADSASTVTDTELEACRLIGQLGGVLGELAETQQAAESGSVPDKSTETKTSGDGHGESPDGATNNTKDADLRGFA